MADGYATIRLNETRTFVSTFTPATGTATINSGSATIRDGFGTVIGEAAQTASGTTSGAAAAVQAWFTFQPAAAGLVAGQIYSLTIAVSLTASGLTSTDEEVTRFKVMPDY